MATGGAHTLYKMGLVGLLLWSLAFSANGESASSTTPEKQAASNSSKDVPATIGSNLDRVTSVFPSDTVFRTLSNESAASADGLFVGASTSALHETSMHELLPEGELDDAVIPESSSEETEEEREEEDAIIQDDVPLDNTHTFNATQLVDISLESSMHVDTSDTPVQTVIPFRNTANDTTVPVRTAISNSSVVSTQSSQLLVSSHISISSRTYESALLEYYDSDESLDSKSISGNSQRMISQTDFPNTLTIISLSVTATPSLNTQILDIIDFTNHSDTSLFNFVSHSQLSSEFLTSSSVTAHELDSTKLLQLTPPSSNVTSSIEQDSITPTHSISLVTSIHDTEDYEEDDLLLGDWQDFYANSSSHNPSVEHDKTTLNSTAVIEETNATKKVQQRRPVPLQTIITNSEAPISLSSLFGSNDIQPSFASSSSYAHNPTSTIQTAVSRQIDSSLIQSRPNDSDSIPSSSHSQSDSLSDDHPQTSENSDQQFSESTVIVSPSLTSRLGATTSLLFYTQILDEINEHSSKSVNIEPSQSLMTMNVNISEHTSLKPVSHTRESFPVKDVTDIPIIRKLANSNIGKLILNNSQTSAVNGSLQDRNIQQNNSLILNEKLPIVNEQVGSTPTSPLDVTDDIAHFQAEYFPDYNTQYYKDDDPGPTDDVYDWPPVALEEDTAYQFRGDGNDYVGESPDYNSEAIAFSAVLSEEELHSPSPPAAQDPEPTPNVAEIEPLSLPVIYDPLLVVSSTQSLPEPATSKRDVRSVSEGMVSTSPAPADIISSAVPADGDLISSSDISSSPIKDKIERYSSVLLPEIELEPSPSVQEMNHTLSSKPTPTSTSVVATGVPHPNSSRTPFSNRSTPHKKQNIDEIISGLKQILGNNVQVANSASVLAPTAESDSTRINDRGPPRFPENDRNNPVASSDSRYHSITASPTATTESVLFSTATRVTMEVEAWQPSASNGDQSDAGTQTVTTHNNELNRKTQPQPLLAENTASGSQSIRTRPVPFVPDLQASLQEVHYTESSVVAVSSMNLLSSRFGVNFSYTRLPPRPVHDNIEIQQDPAPIQEESLTEVVHEPESVSTSSSEFIPSGPITEWVPVYLHPQVQLSTSSAKPASGASAVPPQDNPYSGIPPRYRPLSPSDHVQHYDVVDKGQRPSLSSNNNAGDDKNYPRPYLEQVTASGNVLNAQPPNVPAEVPPPGRRPGVVLPADPNEATPLLPVKSPGWQQRNPADVMVHDTREPAPEPVLADDVGQVFDVTLTATGVMAPGNTGATGRPYVVPVEIDDVHVGNRPPAGPPIVSASGADDQSVFIDGRRTYFNLNPTDVGGAQGGTGGATRVIGVGMNIDDGNSGSNRTPVRTPPRVVRPPSASVNKPNRIRTTTPLIRIDTCIVGDESACDAEHHEVCRTEAGVSSCMCRPGFAHSASKNTCTAVVALLLYLRLDRLDNQRLTFTSAHEDPTSPESQTLEREVVRALDSAFRMTSLGRVYAGVTFNKFYALGGKLAVNVTLMLEETTQTRNHRIKQEVSKELVALIQQRNQNVGVSRLYVDAQFSPIPGVQDVNECSDTDLNDCSPNARCDNILGSFKCSCQSGFTDKYENNPLRSGRICSVCSPEYCNNHGECVLTDGKQECQCKGSYIGSRCEIDGEVLGVALGASLAALLIIILTLVCLCMWSRRWKKDQQKTDMRSSCQAYTTYSNKNAQALTHHVSLEDRIRWAHIADAMSNYYTTDPLNRGPTPLALPPTTTPPPPPSSAPPCSKYQQAQLSRSRTSLIDDDDDPLEDTNRFHVPRPKSRSSYNQSQNIYYDVDYSARDSFPGTLRGSALNAYPLQNMRPYYS